MRLPILIAALSACCLAATTAHADAPGLLPVSGWLADADGVGLEGEVLLSVSLYDSETGGSALYLDRVSVEVDAGFFTAYVGSGSSGAVDLGLFADHDELWIGLAVEDDEEMSPRLLVATAPWAGFAEFAAGADDAERLGGLLASDYRLAVEDADTLATLGLVCADEDLARFDGSSGAWECASLAASAETDPLFSSSPAQSIVSADIDSWDEAFGWGDHAAAGYLSSVPPGSVDSAALAPDAVDSSALAPGAVDTAALAPGAVGAGELAADSVDASHQAWGVGFPLPVPPNAATSSCTGSLLGGQPWGLTTDTTNQYVGNLFFSESLSGDVGLEYDYTRARLQVSCRGDGFVELVKDCVTVLATVECSTGSRPWSGLSEEFDPGFDGGWNVRVRSASGGTLEWAHPQVILY